MRKQQRVSDRIGLMTFELSFSTGGHAKNASNPLGERVRYLNMNIFALGLRKNR